MQCMFSRFFLAAAAVLLFPAIAQAQGLGSLTLHSKLGQPLRAEVAVVSASAKTSGVHASVATPDNYKALGREFNPLLFSINIAVEERDRGLVLVLTSSRPIMEPYLDLLIVLESAGGRVLRDYTVLLDAR